ncbi:MAG TPA: hypothetical protein DCS93_35155 [Microscillaceae bacterium]|nr:hypothetical protein [Microscillaceae bacterium]
MGNNGAPNIAGSSLYLSGRHTLRKWNFGLDLGVLSFMKELTGFTFATPQHILTGGQFDLQNPNHTNPFGFGSYVLRSINKQTQLRTYIQYQFAKRFSVIYNWNFRRIVEVKSFPLTYGIHRFVIRYNFLRRVRDTK